MRLFKKHCSVKREGIYSRILQTLVVLTFDGFSGLDSPRMFGNSKIQNDLFCFFLFLCVIVFKSWQSRKCDWRIMLHYFLQNEARNIEDLFKENLYYFVLNLLFQLHYWAVDLTI